LCDSIKIAMRRAIVAILPPLIGLLLLAATPRWGTAAERQSCTQLLLGRCETCHYLSRVCQRLGKKSKRRWRRTLKNMVRYGAILSKAEMKQLADCLHRQTPEVEKLCTAPGAVERYNQSGQGASR